MYRWARQMPSDAAFRYIDDSRWPPGGSGGRGGPNALGAQHDQHGEARHDVAAPLGGQHRNDADRLAEEPGAERSGQDRDALDRAKGAEHAPPACVVGAALEQRRRAREGQCGDKPDQGS